jgi:hypothetical protein
MAIPFRKRYKSHMTPVNKIRNEMPFIWLQQSARFLNQNYGDVTLAVVIAALVGLIIDAIPVVGPFVSPFASVMISYGLFRYFIDLEAGLKPPTKRIFAIFSDNASFWKLIILVFLGLGFVLISAFILAAAVGSILYFQGNFSLTAMPSSDALKAFALDHYFEMPIIVLLAAIPVLFFYGSFYFAIPLIASKKLPLMEALKASLKANIINWVPLTVFWLSWFMFAVVALAMLAGLAIFGGTLGKLFISLIAIGIAMVGTLYIMPLLSVLGYATYLGIFETRFLHAVPVSVAPAEDAPPPAVTAPSDEAN